jgi:hypothetical protein
MGLLDYERKFSSLRLNRSGRGDGGRGGGRPSPHKVAMLLAVIDAIGAGEVTDNRIYFSQALRTRFSEHFNRLAGPGDRDNPHLPFFHLRSEGFWHHRIKPGMQSAYEQLSTVGGPGDIERHVQYAFLDEELFELLCNSLVAELMKSALLDNLDDEARSGILRKDANYWDWLECEVIVQDYLEMLDKDLKGEPYSKSDHRKALRPRLNNRSEGSIEYKHQNISAVMLEIGLPYIPGYKPAFNYQHQLKQAVLARIARSPEDYDRLIETAEQESDELHQQGLDWDSVLDPEPPETLSDVKKPDRQFLARRINFAEREQRNRRLGESGESFALEFEKARLIRAGREDLAREVVWSSKEEGDGLGFDIRSFDETYESELFLEIKTTNSGKYQPFMITENERAFSNHRAANYRLYRIYAFSRHPRLFELRGAIEQHTRLAPQLYRASF